MENEPNNDRGQEGNDPNESEQHQKTANRSLTVFGPYETLLTRVFDEVIKVLAVIARWIISLAIYVMPKNNKDFAEGAMTELNIIDGYLAKLVWSCGILGAAIRQRIFKKPKKETEEVEQEL